MNAQLKEKKYCKGELIRAVDTARTGDERLLDEFASALAAHYNGLQSTKSQPRKPAEKPVEDEI